MMAVDDCCALSAGARTVTTISALIRAARLALTDVRLT
jgi:hypothetical protein